MTINNNYDIGDQFSYWNFSHTKYNHIIITGILIRSNELLYECENINGSEEPLYFYEHELNTMCYENSNTRTSY